MLSSVSIFGLLISCFWLFLLLQPLLLEAFNLTSLLTNNKIMSTNIGANRQPSNVARTRISNQQHASHNEAVRSEWSTHWKDPNELNHVYQQFEDDDISFDKPKVPRTRKRTTTIRPKPNSLTQTKYFYFIHDPRKFPDFDMEESMPSRLSQDENDEVDESQIPQPPPGLTSKTNIPERDDQVQSASSYGGYQGQGQYMPPPVKHQYKTSKFMFTQTNLIILLCDHNLAQSIKLVSLILINVSHFFLLCSSLVHIHTAPQASHVPQIQVYKSGKDKLWPLILLAALLPLLIGSLILFPFLLCKSFLLIFEI